MTRSEKITIGIFVTAFLGICSMVYVISTEIEEAGGVRGVVISAGKEVKSIMKEINDE